MKKSILLGLIMISLLSACKKDKIDNQNHPAISNTKQLIGFKDFEVIKGVTDIHDVPFQLLTNLDSISLFVKPSIDSKSFKIFNDKFNNYYGFAEQGDFYEIHFSPQNNVERTIKAFVRKTEFQKSSELGLKDVNLYEIRSSSVNGVEDYNNKNFKSLGSIEEITKLEFDEAKKSRSSELLQKNPQIKLNNNHWVFDTTSGKRTLFEAEEHNEEEGLIKRMYIGQSKRLEVEIFKESYEEQGVYLYVLFDAKKSKIVRQLAGFPHVNSHNSISFLTSNSDVGSDLVVYKDLHHSEAENTYMYINFTNFKVHDDGKNTFWVGENTLYAEVFTTNGLLTKGKDPLLSYIKITLN